MNNKEIVKKFVNIIMKNGKKSIASKILNLSIDKASKELGFKKDQLLIQCLNNVKPFVDARSK
jgi:small subunit ribosomal protein S7